MTDVRVNVHHVTRVEGHGNIVVDVRNGELRECRFDVVEAPRFFEAMLRGRRWDEAAHITCRICGICSVGHTTASLRAMENALGVVPSEQTKRMRRLTFHGEMLQSHVLHVYFLVAPDLLGVGSVIPLAESHLEVVQRALRLKKLANDICAVCAGRHCHPVAMVVGGFTHWPTLEELRGLRERLLTARDDLAATVELLQTLELPDFQRETEYVSLTNGGSYPFIEGDLMSSDGRRYTESEYLDFIKERVVDHSTAKHTSMSRDAFMVGALARVNNNFDSLCPEAKSAAAALGLTVPCYNPFMNNIAQVVESVHCVEDAVNLIDSFLETGIQPEEPAVELNGGGRGVAACEVPRGTLYHDYTVDDAGLITGANLIIPTGQNYANIEADMRALVPQILDRPQDEIRHLMEMLVRAYDPCISCSTHLLNVRFV